MKKYRSQILVANCFMSLFAILFVTFLSAFMTVHAADIQVANVDTQSQDSFIRIVINLTENTKYNIVNSLQDKKYFYINLYNISKPYKVDSLSIKDKRVSGIRLQYFEEHKILRFVFYTNSNVYYNITNPQSPARIVVDISDKDFIPTEIYKKKIVIIDPGHGGKSLGGRSMKKINGKYVYEKDLTLSMSKKVKKLLDATPNIVTFMTRNDDSYLSLKERIDFSKQYKGDIFVSIHCNDTRGHQVTTAKGVEFFYWNENASTDAAIAYLEELNNDENLDNNIAVNDPKVKNILKNVLEDNLEAQITESSKVCGFLNDSFCETDYFRINNRGIKSARFKVLENYLMPSVLIETGFINNNDDFKNLTSDSFQEIIAKSIYNSIIAYFAKEDPKFQMSLLKVK